MIERDDDLRDSSIVDNTQSPRILEVNFFSFWLDGESYINRVKEILIHILC